GLVKSPLKVLKSKLLFEGRTGGNFLTLPSVCAPNSISYMEAESYEGQVSSTATHTPVGVEGCENVPFSPSTSVSGETSSDEPDGATVDVHAPQNIGPEEINTADIRDAQVTLPEGMTLNPPAARGLETCSESQIAIGTANPPTCPAGSRVGTVTIETDLPPGSLTGGVYLGNPAGGPITGPPYTIYLDAESSLGVSVKLVGLVQANPTTGRLQATFTENPELPFEDLKLTFNSGPRAPLANPLACGEGKTESLFTPYTAGPNAVSSTPFQSSGCPNPLPFTLTQSTADSSSAAGAHTNFTFDLARNDGQQYLSKVSTTLPGGLVGSIASVPLCAEPQAAAGTCSSASQIGTASVSVGSGSEPYPFTGPVYLTTGYGGAPYGLSVPVHAAAGPFDFGMVITRAGISIDPHTARVIVNAGLSTIVSGVPLRLRSVSVNVNRANFLLNPTNCGALATQSTLTSTFGAGDALSSPLQVSGCSALAFAPKFSVSTSAKASRLKGASLKVKLTQPAGQANLHEVHVELPKQLVARLSTLNQACTAVAFEANPASCPAASNVGTATASTPILPVSLSGPAYLVSHGNEAFPDLEVVLSGDGVTVVLDGQTKITGAVTSSTFSTIPDVPVSSFQLSLPTGSHSALSAVGNLCTKPLYMPTTIVAQSAKKIAQKTKISVAGCARIKILSHRVKGHRLILRVRVPGAGRLKASGTDLRSLTRKVRKAGVVTLKLGLSKRGLARLRQKGRLTIRAHIGFTAKRGVSAPTLSAKASFRR
ncbi:MAG: hypothetical protein ACRDK2_00580, partial [Solirubrobacteraceae bacterium]